MEFLTLYNMAFANYGIYPARFQHSNVVDLLASMWASKAYDESITS